ncbi:LytR/AlgR family response regulator transcription factor [Zunongwangia endophytica]|uniref:LytR/AlgR family response regulator transcription factor n=1 Tax=Zunongwangia endophytica TaxID=1808945 RepID=A0ABV8HBJ2_9FLAO|nr:LytTR family DNA-binding domain-containing protein [Zunongwangia endophytica]MDN3594952.1 LytTR family DNA-binding domain-containing protein [Zunongwangia endophytica]
MQINFYYSNVKNFITTLLLQPYPFYYEGKSLRIIIILFLFMTFSFNYAFEPFNVEFSEHKMNYFWISIIHSITPVIILIILSIIGKLFRLEHKWNIAKEVILILLFFTLVGLGQYLIRDLIYNNENNWSLHYLQEEIRNTFLVGSLFVTILIPYNFNRLNNKHRSNANSLNNTINDNSNLAFHSKDRIKINNFEFNIDDFMFAKSEGNYLEIYLQKNPQDKELIRGTMKNLEANLKTHPSIIKTHRSYLVNSKYIENIKGNAQGYQLQIDQYIVPVSRNMIEHFNLNMKRA